MLMNEFALRKAFWDGKELIIFFRASFLGKKQSFFPKNDALKEFLWAVHNSFLFPI
jgi:hypothetical protein